MQRCSICIIPDSFPGITFENGVCGFCRSYPERSRAKHAVLGAEALYKLISSNRSGTFDCAVPISGGKDSSYVLYYTVRNLKLKPLALFMDSGFTNDFARRNVERECAALGVELVIGHPTEFRRLLVREALETSKRLGRFVRMCGNCENNIRSFVINECRKHGILFIIWGSTDFEDSAAYFLSDKETTHRQTFGRFGNVFRRAAKAARTLFSSRRSLGDTLSGAAHGIRCLYYGVRDNRTARAPEGIRTFDPFLEVSYEGKGVRSLSLFDYVEYDPFRMIEILKREVGWESPAEKESRMDCRIHCFGNFQHLRDTGITRDGFTMAYLVRAGRMSREEALRREDLLARDAANECRAVFDELGVDAGIILNRASP
jgi:hypothetical protein